MKKAGKFLASVFLSGVCLVPSSFCVMAENGQNAPRQITAACIHENIENIRRRVMSERIETIINDLNGLFEDLKKAEKKIPSDEQRKFCGEFRKLLEYMYRLPQPCYEKIDELYDKILVFGKSCYSEPSMPVPKAPRIKPMQHEVFLNFPIMRLDGVNEV